MHICDSAIAKTGDLIDKKHHPRLMEAPREHFHREELTSSAERDAKVGYSHFISVGDWDKHVSTVLELTGQLDSIESPFTDNDMSSKLIQ